MADLLSCASDEDELLRKDTASKKRKVSKQEMFCGHCGLMLCLKTFKRHKRLYFDEETMKWVKERTITTEG